MTRTMWRWTVALTILFAADLAASVHAYLTWHKSPNGPTVMTLGQLLGFASSATLLVVILMIVGTGIRDSLRRRRFDRILRPPRP